MADTTLHSIGHGNKPIALFIAELKAFDITYLMDVRSKPYSRWHPHFNRESLQEALASDGITYVYAGDALGGLPDDPSCYGPDGKVVYDLLEQKDFFQSGIGRLLAAHGKQVPLAVMCSETHPEDCHRSKLIGRALQRHGISLHHIIHEGLAKPQEIVMNELTKGKGTVDLFGKETDFTSRKSY